MTKVNSLFLLVLFLCSVGFSLDFEFLGNPVETYYENGTSVAVYPEADLTLEEDENPIRLYLTGSGVRTKKVFIFEESVYVGASYVDHNNGIDGTNPLASVQSTARRATFLTMVRQVTAGQVRSGFSDALQVNNVALNDPPIAKILRELNFPLNPGQQILIVGSKNNQQQVHISAPNKQFSSVGSSVADDLWSVWFGIPVDSGMANLKNGFIGNRE